MNENVPDGMAAIRARAAARTTGLLDFIEHRNHPIVPAPRAAVGVVLVEKVAVAAGVTTERAAWLLAGMTPVHAGRVADLVLGAYAAGAQVERDRLADAGKDAQPVEDQADTVPDQVPLGVLLDAAAEAMAGRPAEALRAMFGMVASVVYRAGRRDAFEDMAVADAEDERADRGVLPATGCPDWCAVHHVDPPDTVCHFTAETTVGRVPVWASRVVTDGQAVEELVSVGGETMTTATARTLASVIVAAAGRLDGAR